MKNLKTVHQDKNPNQFKKFNMLVAGSKMATASTIILILISIALIFYSKANVFSIISLIIGAAVQVVYIFKYLLLKNIDKNIDTPVLLTSNILKFKTYVAKRKNNELIYMSIWILSILPFASIYLGSEIKALIGAVLFILIVGFFGMLSFRKVDNELEKLKAL
ncbi:MAG: hypothetical protein ABI295_01955 [Xanthomarina sp.]